MVAKFAKKNIRVGTCSLNADFQQSFWNFHNIVINDLKLVKKSKTYVFFLIKYFQISSLL